VSSKFFQIAHELQAIPVRKTITIASDLHEGQEGLKINEYTYERQEFFLDKRKVRFRNEWIPTKT
jgi:hypothetical protein